MKLIIDYRWDEDIQHQVPIYWNPCAKKDEVEITDIMKLFEGAVDEIEKTKDIDANFPNSYYKRIEVDLLLGSFIIVCGMNLSESRICKRIEDNIVQLHKLVGNLKKIEIYKKCCDKIMDKLITKNKP